MPTIARKLCLLVTGQSNETQIGKIFGGSVANIPRTPLRATLTAAVGGRTGTGIYEILPEHIAARHRDWFVTVANHAVAGSDFVGMWTGQTNGTPLAYGTAGFDPNGYIAGAAASAVKFVGLGYDVWHFTTLGGNDIAANWTAAAIAASHIQVIQRMLASGASKVFVNLVHGRAINFAADYKPGGRQYVARDTIMSAFASDPRVQFLVDMSGFLDNNFKFDVETHLNHMGCLYVARAHRDRLIELGHI